MLPRLYSYIDNAVMPVWYTNQYNTHTSFINSRSPLQFLN